MAVLKCHLVGFAWYLCQISSRHNKVERWKLNVPFFPLRKLVGWISWATSGSSERIIDSLTTTGRHLRRGNSLVVAILGQAQVLSIRILRRQVLTKYFWGKYFLRDKRLLGWSVSSIDSKDKKESCLILWKELCPGHLYTFVWINSFPQIIWGGLVMHLMFDGSQTGSNTGQEHNLKQLSSTSIAVPVGHVLHPAIGKQSQRLPQEKEIFKYSYLWVVV